VELKIYHLHNGEYREAAMSLALPGLPIRALPQGVATGQKQSREIRERGCKAFATMLQQGWFFTLN
jgi:hypothetical protein